LQNDPRRTAGNAAFVPAAGEISDQEAIERLLM
jgi:hypothetical protein